MLRLSECINEGFFGNGYDSYKRKVLDALASVGIVIDDKKMGKAEKWIRDYYTDKMNAYDCASAVRDVIKQNTSLKEAFEKFASDVIDSAPALQKKRAVKRVMSMTRDQKDEFDEILLRISEEKGRPAKELASDIGYEIVRLIQDGMLTKEEIIERLSRGILKVGKMNLDEALEIIKESGKVASMSDYIGMVKAELIKMDFGESYTDSLVDRYYRKTVAFYFNEGFTPEETAEHIRALEDDEA